MKMETSGEVIRGHTFMKMETSGEVKMKSKVGFFTFAAGISQLLAVRLCGAAGINSLLMFDFTTSRNFTLTSRSQLRTAKRHLDFNLLHFVTPPPL